MATQTIAILGADGETGSELAIRLARQNRYRLLLMAQDDSQFARLSTSIREKSPNDNPEVIACLKDGCWEADIIILDIPPSSDTEVAKKIRDVSTQKIVFIISANDDTIAVAREENWQKLLPNAKTVSAFVKAVTGETILGGNDNESIKVMEEIIKDIGFKPVIRKEGQAPNTRL